jgi:hypothetical protein
MYFQDRGFPNATTQDFYIFGLFHNMLNKMCGVISIMMTIFMFSNMSNFITYLESIAIYYRNVVVTFERVYDKLQNL